MKAVDKRNRFLETLKRFVPENFAPYLTDEILAGKVVFKIVSGRKSKLGDFRSNPEGGLPTITVNGDLNPYSFLITSLHELAHLHTFQRYGNRVQPHGEEWKNAFRKLLLPVLDSKELPKSLENALWRTFTVTKASSCSDIHLTRELRKYDKNEAGLTLEEIPKNTTFVLNGRVFTKGNLRRSRYICTEVASGKQFLVHALANIQLVKNNDE